MKKIIVSGCSNCPFFILWNDGEGNGVDSISKGTCKNPTFNRELPNPEIWKGMFLNTDEYPKTSAWTTPDWCPLPEDK